MLWALKQACTLHIYNPLPFCSSYWDRRLEVVGRADNTLPVSFSNCLWHFFFFFYWLNAYKSYEGQVKDPLRMVGPRPHYQLFGHSKKKNAPSYDIFYFDSSLFAVASFCSLWKELWWILLPWVFKIGALYSAPLKPRQQAALAVPQSK